MADDPFERVRTPELPPRRNNNDAWSADSFAPVSPAVAYSRPMQQSTLSAERNFDMGPVRGVRDQRRRRRNFVVGLGTLAILASLAAFALSSMIVTYGAAALWGGWTAYLGLMYVAMRRGMITTSRTTRATNIAASRHRERDIEVPAASFSQPYDNEFYEPESSQEWAREARYAAGQ
jgi:hypothetical protein